MLLKYFKFNEISSELLKFFLHCSITHCQEVLYYSGMNSKRKIDETFYKMLFIFSIEWFGLEFVIYLYDIYVMPAAYTEQGSPI